jgi:hypothetical protein
MAPGANFTAYQEIKKLAHKYQPELTELPSYQHMVIGLISGAMGPFSNAPIDTIKTRMFLIIFGLRLLRRCISPFLKPTQVFKKQQLNQARARSRESQQSRATCGVRKVCVRSTRVSLLVSSVLLLVRLSCLRYTREYGRS